MRLHGRDVELEAIAEALDDAVDGEFRALVLVGEAGIGKSAVLAAAADRAEERNARVVQGRAAEHEGSVPFGLAIDALDDEAARMQAARLAAAGPELALVLPSAADGPAPEQPTAATAGPGERFRYHRTLTAFVEMLARERPTAVLLDDLQWADAASFEWVLHMLNRPPRAPGLLVLATRPGVAAARLLQAVRASGEYLALAPLEREAAMSALTEGEDVEDAALAARIADEAAGNPLFLRELARAARRSQEGLPRTIAAAVGQELERLDPDCRRLLEAAAVAGDPFDAELAAAAAGVETRDALDALDALVAAGLVHAGDGASFGFRHPLVRRAVYDGAPPGWRLAAHERAARLLADRGAPASVRAYHVERFALTGDDEAVSLLETAAQADADTSPAAAVRWLRAALRLLPARTGAHRARLLAPLGDALAATGQLEEALDAYDEALRIGLVPGAHTEVAAEAARVERQLGRNVAALERLLDIAPATGGSERAMLEFEIGHLAYVLGDVDGMISHARAGIEHSDPGDPAALALVDTTEAFVGMLSRAIDHTLVERAERRALALPAGAEPLALEWIGTMSFGLERFRPAAQVFERAAEAALRARRDLGMPQLRATLALALHFDLQPRAALESAEASEDGARLREAAAQIGFGANTRALVLDILGRPGDARAAAEESQRFYERCEETIYTTTGAAINMALLHEHDPERLLREVLALLGGGSEPLVRPTSLLQPLVAAALAVGRRADAEAWVQRVEASLDAGRPPATNVRAICARADLLLAADDVDTAAERARAAVAMADREEVRLDAARARIVLGRALAAAGDRDGAVAALERVLADAGAAGAERLVSEASRELRRAGARAPAAFRRPSAGEELTERERSIAELVAEGRSNKEVAATLFLSGKTVENNLSRIYAKLGVRSRTELARTLHEQRPG